ncbi:G-protein coupled receptor GRL101-like [Amphiura filiformis]|uniref:G-protein coupled receptor GRL101-like n=1 Tax=Amphiura filiformis TaxID=82378 RepID=UPI003B213DE4
MIDNNTFIGFPTQTVIVVSQSEICECYLASDNCKAAEARSPYLTCDRLMSDRVLLGVMWLIGLSAIGGNLFVLCRKKTKQEKGKIQIFLLSNLALSDLIIGIYMLIIASADIYFGEYFPMHAEYWRTGVTCRIAGAMAILSSEASVFFVTLISIDRFMNIRFPYSSRKLRTKSSAVTVAFLWLISCALGVVPSIFSGKNFKFYENSHVCIGLPLAQVERFEIKNAVFKKIPLGDTIYSVLEIFDKSVSLGYVPGLYYASAIFLGLNGICIIIILVCYVEIVRSVKKSSKRVGRGLSMKDQIKMTAKVSAIILTDFFCWAPVIVLGILVQTGVMTLPSSVFAWCVSVILPINSAINPYLYTIAALISKYRKKRKQRETPEDENKRELPRPWDQKPLKQTSSHGNLQESQHVSTNTRPFYSPQDIELQTTSSDQLKREHLHHPDGENVLANESEQAEANI